MPVIQRIVRLIKTGSELGFKKSAFFGTYLLARKSGFYSKQKSVPSFPEETFHEPNWIQTFFSKKETLLQTISTIEKEAIISAAKPVTNGKMLAFGMIPQPISFDDQRNATHWSKISDAFGDGDDIKLHWESARFAWAFPLIQAHHLTEEQDYYEIFKKYLLEFDEKNPYPSGIQWLSAQEVAFRMIAMISAYCVFSENIHKDLPFQIQMLKMIWQHAHRIPSTIIYARAQNNNHLLSDALGMMYAGAFFHTLPEGKKWLEKGWRIFNETLQSQIQPNGTYVQQSMNYHRLMLTECIWAKKIADQFSLPFPPNSIMAIQNATNWLGQFIQKEYKPVPNLGHNDGSLIFPLSNQNYIDYQTIFQTCQYLFLPDKKTNKTNIINWLNINPQTDTPEPNTPAIPVIDQSNLFIYIRAEEFTERPAHADQNHVDICFNGENIAMDAGTYRYTNVDPWNNGLAHTINHNTITINDEDQMTWAGRFRWLDWSKGKYILDECNDHQISAVHNGYIKFGILHKRTIKRIDDQNLEVEDILIPQNNHPKVNICRLHWLLPDGNITIAPEWFKLQTEKNNISIKVNALNNNNLLPTTHSIIRCGQILYGDLNTSLPTCGWYSPTYQVKLPAISYIATITEPQFPLTIFSQWKLSSL